ncbi:MAG: hypothetical protein V1718_04445, partial [archaeon]
MRRGYSISSIAIIAVIGVAVLAAWMNYQSTAGVKPMERIAGDQSILKANMETVKSISEPTLKHASNAAALDLAIRGGGEGTETVWFCNGMDATIDPHIAPSLPEILYHLSNGTLTNLNTFLDDSTEIFKELDVLVEPYECAEIQPEFHPPNCPRDGYPISCDGWNLTATGGSLSSKENEGYHKYVGDINTFTDENRLFWMYYRLLEAQKEVPILEKVKE